jgi:hypothetical protein
MVDRDAGAETEAVAGIYCYLQSGNIVTSR